MIARLRTFGKDILIYGIGSVVSKFITILTVPLLTKVYAVAEYGTIDLVTVTSSILLMLIVLGVDSSIAFFYNSSKDEERIQYTSTAAVLRAMSGVLIAGVSCLFSAELSRALFKTPAYRNVIVIAFAAVPLKAFVEYYLVLARVMFKAWIFNFVVLFQVVSYIGLLLVFTAVLRFPIEGVFLSQVVSNAIVLAFCVVYFRSYTRPRFDLSKAREMLAYGVPLVPIAVAYWVLNGIDRFVLNRQYGTIEIGLYSAGMKVATLVSLFTTAVQMAWGPFALSIKEDPGCRSVYATVAKIYLMIGAVLVIGACAVNRLLLYYFTTPEYLGGASVVGILALSLVLSGSYYLFSIGVSITKKTAYITYTSFAAALASIAFNFTLVPLLGIMGAAISSVAANLVSVVGICIISQRFYRISYDWAWVGRLSLVFTVFFVAVQLVTLENLWIEGACRMALLLAFVGACFLVGLLRLRDFEALLGHGPAT